MNLIEQKYKNLNRRYFRGQREDWSEKDAVFNEMYYTTSLEYAFFYAIKHENGVITEYRLNEDADIFNLNSKKDYFTLHKYLNDTNNNQLLSELDDLKRKDWLFFFRDYDKRNELLSIIKSLGYDGYFNYEFDKEYVEKASEYDLYDIPLNPNNPSIGVFNNSVFKKVKTWTLDEIENSEIAKKFRQKEINLIKKNYKKELEYQLRHNNSIDKEKAYYSIIGYELHLIFLSVEEFEQLVDELDKEWTNDKIEKELREEIKRDVSCFLNDKRILISEEKRKIFEKILKEN